MTTRNPYNFDNFSNYFKTTTKNPKYAYNYIGENSFNSPVVNHTSTQLK